MIVRFYKGGISYEDLTDRPEAGELFEAASIFARAWNEAEKIQRQRDEAKARQQ